MLFSLASVCVFFSIFATSISRPTRPAGGVAQHLLPSGLLGAERVSSMAETKSLSYTVDQTSSITETRPISAAQMELFAHSFAQGIAFRVDKDLRKIVDSGRANVTIIFLTTAWKNPVSARKDPKDAAYAKTDALLLLQQTEAKMGLHRPYTVQFINHSPTSFADARRNGFRLIYVVRIRDRLISKTYEGHIEGCRGDCSEVRGSLKNKPHRPLLFDGSLFEKLEGSDEEDVMYQCREYVRSALNQ